MSNGAPRELSCLITRHSSADEACQMAWEWADQQKLGQQLL